MWLDWLHVLEGGSKSRNSWGSRWGDRSARFTIDGSSNTSGVMITLVTVPQSLTSRISGSERRRESAMRLGDVCVR